MVKKEVKSMGDICPLCRKVITGYYVKLAKNIKIHHECYLNEKGKGYKNG